MLEYRDHEFGTISLDTAFATSCMLDVKLMPPSSPNTTFSSCDMIESSNIT
jgi:hypothetical protein